MLFQAKEGQYLGHDVRTIVISACYWRQDSPRQIQG